VRTIQRDILTLEADLEVPLVPQSDRYTISGSYFLPPVTLSLYEAVVVFLACRLALRQTDENNQHLKGALVRIFSVLPAPLASQLIAMAKDVSAKPDLPGQVKVFEDTAIAWTTQRKMRMKYRSAQSADFKEWLLSPYFMDMTGTGYSIYVTGQGVREGKEGVFTFKLERMAETEVTNEHFEIPPGLDYRGLLASSWGVFTGEAIGITLKFSPAVTRRVKESVWHPSQTIEDTPDGGCVLTLQVNSTVEIAPWIRGWGAEVEVLEPKTLREEFRWWSEQSYALYHPGRTRREGK
jgi:proteasome accessory factor B